MGSGTVIFSSVTYAMKAQNLLSRYKIKSEMHKTHDSVKHSCSYRVTIPSNFKEAIKLLSAANLEYTIPDEVAHNDIL